MPTHATPPRLLADQQTEAFDVEYVIPQLWALIEPYLAARLGGPSRFLDIGGGNGVFTDRVMDAFPQSEGVIVHSRTAWLRKVAQAGLQVEGTQPGYHYGTLSPTKRLLLHMGQAQVGAIIARRG